MAEKKKLESRSKKSDKEVRNRKSEQSSNVKPQRQTSKIKHPTSQPTTMEELLSVTGYTLKGIKKGDVVEGTVTRVSPKEITVDVGGKTEGVVIDRELENYRDMLMELAPGDKVVAQVIVAENDRGQSVLSLRRSIFEKRWEELAARQKSGDPVDVILKEPVRGGVLVDFGGLRGYIPQSQLDTNVSKQAERVSGRKVSVKVVEVDKETNRLVFSQRAISEGATLAKQKDLLDALTVGESVQATITGVVPFGAFARLSVTKNGQKHDIEGLIHISEIAWEKVEDVGQYLKTGDNVKVKVIGVDPATGKLTLSL
jgi:small subunit ribosomal protein S1